MTENGREIAAPILTIDVRGLLDENCGLQDESCFYLNQPKIKNIHSFFPYVVLCKGVLTALSSCVVTFNCLII